MTTPDTPTAGWLALIGRRVSGMTTDGEAAEGELLHVAEHHVEVLCDDGVVRLLHKRGLRVGVRPIAAPTQYRSDTLYVTDSVRADLRAAMQTTPVVRLDSTSGAWTVADGWTAAETEPGMFTVQRDGEPVAVVRGPGVRLDIGMTAPRRPALAGAETKERKP